MRILLSDQPAEGNGSSNAAPPKAAEIVASGKSEREILLERQNAKQTVALQKLADAKRKLETDNAHLADENFQLKQIPKPQTTPAKEKFSWMGFGAN